MHVRVNYNTICLLRAQLFHRVIVVGAPAKVWCWIYVHSHEQRAEKKKCSKILTFSTIQTHTQIAYFFHSFAKIYEKNVLTTTDLSFSLHKFVCCCCCTHTQSAAILVVSALADCVCFSIAHTKLK